MTARKTLLIIGAGSDMAKAIARKFASRNYAIQLAGRRVEEMERLQKDLENRYGAETWIYNLDVADFDTHDAFVSTLNVVPDIVVYSAGVMSDQATAARDWNKAKNMVDVNYAGAVSLLNKIAEIFRKRNAGCIVGISSVAGDRGRGSNYIYGSTKAAFTAYLSGLRNELFKQKVQVLTVKPGFVYTKMTQHLDLPARLTAQPEKVAEKIFQAVLKKKDIIYIKPAWRWIMQAIRIIPEPVFKRTKL